MYILRRDGREVIRGSAYDIYTYIHKTHSYSTSNACQYEGYTVEKDGKDITSDFILK